MKKAAGLCLLLAVQSGVALATPAAVSRPRSLYGADGRTEFYRVRNPTLRHAFSSVAALFMKTDVQFGFDGINLSSETAGQEQKLCPRERFADQPSSATCTGVLIDRNLVLTAGHCMPDAATCAKMVVGFDYFVSEPGVYPRSIPWAKTYSCVHLLDAQNTAHDLDYAIFQLDRPVDDRDPLPLATQAQLIRGESVFVVGLPMGVPAKADRGLIRSVGPHYFETNLDTYRGNSGSPVLDPTARAVLGILIEGENDFVKHGTCFVSKKCKDTACEGENVCRTSAILHAFRERYRP